MKLERTLALALSFVLILVCCTVSAFAKDEEVTKTVKLLASFNNWEEADMQSEDGKIFTLTQDVEAGNYQFIIKEDGKVLGHPGTVKDTTANVCLDGWALNPQITTKTTFIATGGAYIFTYNTETDMLQLVKKGATAPTDKGDDLTISFSGKKITAKVGDKLSYTVNLKADKVFEDVQTALSYNSKKLELKKTALTEACPNLGDVTFNNEQKGVVTVNSSSVAGFDFTKENMFLTLEFEVLEKGETALEFTVQDMTVKGAQQSYYFYSVKKSDGAVFTEDIKNNSVQETTAPTTPSEPASTPASESTDPSEAPSTAPSNPATKPSDSTDPIETTEVTTPTSSAPATSATTGTEGTTTSTDPSETRTTGVGSTYELGDVNRDGKLNIRDATAIQKHLAKLIDFDDEQKALADFQADGKLNIKDATRIQKKLANLL